MGFTPSASPHPIWAMGMELDTDYNPPARYLPFLILGFGKFINIIKGWMLQFTNRSQEGSYPVGQSRGLGAGEKGGKRHKQKPQKVGAGRIE